jgi:hypothetical protein
VVRGGADDRLRLGVACGHRPGAALAGAGAGWAVGGAEGTGDDRRWGLSNARWWRGERRR